MRIFTAVLLPLTLLPAAPAHAAPALDAATVDHYVTGYLDRTGLPGASVAVTQGDRVIRATGYGKDAHGAPITATTAMPIASMSKSFTALAVVQLAERGRLRLDAPLREHLPEFRMADPRAAAITVRQLLTQTSGMADSAYPDLTLDQPTTLRDAVARLADAPLAADPGTTMNYHNPNYEVAARLVEVVTGRPFADHLTAEVFSPLGMTGTTTVDSTTDLPGAATGHVRAYGTVIRTDQPRWYANGSHGVAAPATDLARWLITQNGAGPQLVTPAGLTTLHTPPAGSTYAMGWSASTPGRLQHTGSLLTHNSMQILLPATRHGIAVVTNTGMISGDDSVLLADGLAALAQGRTPPDARPFTMDVDPWLAALTVLALTLGTVGVLRSGRWAARRTRRPTTVLRLLPYPAAVLFFFLTPTLWGILFRGRAATLAQTLYGWPALFVLFATTATAATAVLLTRTRHLIRLTGTPDLSPPCSRRR